MRAGCRVGTIPRIHSVDPPSAESRATPEHIQAALEASCEALLTLELMRVGVGTAAGVPDGLQTHLVQATKSLRRAIAELRMARRDDAGVLTLGFVVGAGRGFKRHRRKPPGEISVKPAANGIDRRLDTAR